ncbi:calponin y domain-containing protein [Tripterygium wilfordii]|uniref:Calponin y domain-containing protein n=1 Tax=Tripterygium wilfordii TaxID=458696 RepID=A0A7J7DP79_TRIWF|nr:calponin y domain-containing protein [Tripterygium wilfordii]
MPLVGIRGFLWFLTKLEPSASMGKPIGKKKTQKSPASPKTGNINSKSTKPSADRTSKAFDEDTAIFMAMSQELKEEGNRLFQRRDHEGAMLK